MKKILALFSVFAIAISLSVPASAVTVSTEPVSAWDWIAYALAVSTDDAWDRFSFIWENLDTFSSTSVCLRSNDSLHHGKIVGLKGASRGRYTASCVCDYCGESFSAVVTEDMLKASYISYVSSLDLVFTSPNNKYSYNGYTLPGLPDWDRETYPYYFLFYKNGIFTFRAADRPLHYETFTNNLGETFTFPVLHYFYGDARQVVSSSLVDGAWTEPQYSDRVSVTTDDYWLYFTAPILFSNHDIVNYDNDTLYLVGSDPVFVSGGVGRSDRIDFLMSSVDAYNNSNSYLEDEDVVNFYLSPDSGETLYSPAIFNESTMTFYEPISGNSYVCSEWIYHYTDDNVLVFDGITVNGFYYGSYILELATPITVNGYEIPAYWICYMDDGVYVVPYWADDSGDIHTPGWQVYSYVMVSQNECNINGHTYTYENVSIPTCIAPGERKYTCSTCGNEYAEEIPATGHSMQFSVLREATCAAAGLALYTCSACGTEYTEEIPALDHDFLVTEITGTTYTLPDDVNCPDCSGMNYSSALDQDAGIYQLTCLDCGAVWQEDAEITYGQTTYTCSICGATKVESNAEEATQETWFNKFIFKFSWLSSIAQIYKQLVADVTSDAATAAAVANGAVMLSDVTGDHAATDGETVAYTAPELAIVFGDSDKYGVDWVNIKPLDLSWYAPYKETVDGILSGILWLSYLFLLIKRAPGIVRGSEMVTEDRIKIDNWNIRHNK